MGATENGFAISKRLRREDCKRTKHDSAFSNWKILIGTSDWEDHAQGEDGAEKYRIKNLPNCTSCPGVYELGIVLSRSGRETRKHDSDSIIPVYLGKSDSVRNRLQQYGRDGAHLENGSSNFKLDDCNNIHTGEGRGPGLFSDIFLKGFSIVYRWAPMTNPREAEKTEAELLDKFDYAWNKGSNGPRRQNDILKRIDCSLKRPQFLQELQLFPQRRKGIKIKACSRPLLGDAYNFYTDFLPNNFLARVLKFGRSRPIFVSWKSGIDEYCPSICGVALGHGVVCRKPPSEGRKRCAEHKGMKINAASSRLVEERKFTLAVDKHLVEKDFAPVYGVVLPGGSSCTTEPIQGNKRSLEHKGCQVHDSSPPQSLHVKKEYGHGQMLDYINNKNKLPEKGGKLNPSSGEQVSLRDGDTICGVGLEDGTFCTRQPPRGRKRCEEHKGICVKKAGSKSFTEEISCEFDSSVAKSCCREEEKNHAFPSSVFSDKSSYCGMTLQNGGFCSRMPVEGNKRCWQHKGKKVEQNHMFPSIMDEKFSPTCNATLSNGSFCIRNPTDGNKRCLQHKGMRAGANSGSSTCYKSEYHDTASTRSSFGSVNEDMSQTCGAPLHNGSYCRRRSRGRCWQHEVDASSGNKTYNSHYHSTASRYSSYDSLCEHTPKTCGAPLRNGSYCRRRSNGPCWQHRG